MAVAPLTMGDTSVSCDDRRALENEGSSKRKRQIEEEDLHAETVKHDKKKRLKVEQTINVEDVPAKKKTTKSINDDVDKKETVSKAKKNSRKTDEYDSAEDDVIESKRRDDDDENMEIENIKTNESQIMDSKMEADSTFPGNFSGEWTKEEHLELLEQVQQLLPEKDVHDYNTTLKKWDWKNVKVNGRSSNECRAEYHGILKKLRKYKTMTEIIADAREWLEQDSAKLKKPSRPHEQYFMAHRAKYISKHPELSMAEVMARLSKKYEKLSDEKKQKYVDKYNEEMRAYKQERVKSRKGEEPPKFPPNPLQLYIREKYEELKDSGNSKGTIYQEEKAKWKTLGNDKKMKYINESLRLKKDYDIKLKAYCELHPDHRPADKSILTKSEQQIKDDFLGKPKKPSALSGYQVFTQEYNKQLNCPLAERGPLVAKAWKDLTEEQKKEYNDAAREAIKEYKEKLTIFKKMHPEELINEDEKIRKLKKDRN